MTVCGIDCVQSGTRNARGQLWRRMEHAWAQNVDQLQLYSKELVRHLQQLNFLFDAESELTYSFPSFLFFSFLLYFYFLECEHTVSEELVYSTSRNTVTILFGCVLAGIMCSNKHLKEFEQQGLTELDLCLTLSLPQWMYRMACGNFSRGRWTVNRFNC